MARSDLADTVVVLDLDDTLYAEHDYLLSGIRAVAAEIRRLFRRDLEADLLAMVGRKDADLWAHACEALGLPPTAKDQFLWIYRLHAPSIRLSAGVSEALEALKACRKVVILTDGRAISQRAKLAALGLAGYEAYISEEHGSAKPDPARFQAIMAADPGATYVYVADNPTKDFIAPNALGWLTIGVRDAGGNIHAYDLASLPASHHPRLWIDGFAELMEHLC